jgi:UDP-glucose 4-epimerase
MNRIWILGSGGMLGSALRRNFLRRNIPVFEVPEAFEWSNLERLNRQFKVSSERFFYELSSNDSWEIYWVCGTGTMGSSVKAMNRENQCFVLFLNIIKQKIVDTKSSGVIAYASSAGAIYAGSLDFEITEESETCVINEYGRSKLFQEKQLENLILECNKVKVLIARFSTLYGPGQGFGKNQGLITHIARSALRNYPLRIFVPLATARDYIFVDDAATDFICSVQEIKKMKKIFFKIKIIAFERSTSIAEILSTFSRLMRKRMAVLLVRSELTYQYPLRVSYLCSASFNNRAHLRRRTLIEGLHATLEAEKLIYFRLGYSQ